MSDEKLTKEERATAEFAISHLHEAVENLQAAYERIYKLTTTYCWDLDYDAISQSAMLSGKVALDIVDSIAAIDGWEQYKSKKYKKA